MSSLNSSGSLGNVISRLQGLKNVSGRRVMPGAEFLQDLEEEDNDVSGTSSGMPDIPPNSENLPESDLGGELTAQSYDVRANSVTPPSQASLSPAALSPLAKALNGYLTPQEPQNAPPIETQQVEMAEGLPPVSAEQQQQEPSFWSKLKDEVTRPYHGGSLSNAWEGAKDYLKEGYTPKLDEAVYDRNPNLQRPPEMVQQQQEKKALDQKQIDEAQMNPWQVAAYGATDTFANSPELVAQFEEYTGLDFNDQQKEMTDKYEKVLSDLQSGYEQNDASYDEQEKRIKERILNNQSNDADKFYIGLALLMPLLVGGLFGKEAALGALGGGAKGLADVYKGRQEGIQKDEELLSDIYKQRAATGVKKGELEIERLKIPEQVKKNLPKDEYEDVKGMNVYAFKDPETGEIVESGVEVLPDFYMDVKYGNTPQKREKMREQAVKLGEEKASLEKANQATSDVINAALQLKDAGILSQILAYALAEDKNGALKKFVRSSAPDIMIGGRKQNSAVYIDSKIEQIKDAYRRTEQMRNFTDTISAHVGAMAENPQYSGLQPQDLIDQMLILRDRGQSSFVDRASAQGFARTPLEGKFGKLNRELYKGLNQKEEMTQLERDKQLMHASE